MNLSQNLRQSAARHPNKHALLIHDQQVTYAELDRAVDRFAAGLSKLGIQPGARVGILLGNAQEFIVAYYAIARIGAVSVPVNPLFTPGEVQFIFQDAGVEAVVALPPMQPLFAAMRPVLPTLQHVILTGVSEAGEGCLAFAAIDGEPSEAPQPAIDSDELAVILYTSGTTGKPKGAMLSHRNLCSNADQAVELFQLRESDIMTAVLPIFHIFCMTVCLNAPLVHGATILLLPKFSPTETAKAMRDHQATLFAGVPTMYNFLVQHPEVTKEDLASIRMAVAGGSSLPLAVLDGFQAKFDIPIVEGYGLSEASPIVTFNPVDGVRKPGTIGLPIPGVEVRVVREDGVDCGPHEVGELICRGENVMLGYLNRPEETAVTLRDGWLFTGDLAICDEDGYFSIVDRKKDMIIVGGFNVYPREVEEVLFKHPQVREAAVVGSPDPNYGEKVLAFVAAKDESLTVEALIDYCKQHLVTYKVPKEIHLLDELPKNTTGKILRRELKKNVESNPTT